jgi:D-serine dehydratase
VSPVFNDSPFDQGVHDMFVGFVADSSHRLGGQSAIDEKVADGHLALLVYIPLSNVGGNPEVAFENSKPISDCAPMELHVQDVHPSIKLVVSMRSDPTRIISVFVRCQRETHAGRLSVTRWEEG